jgi:hypothetical protein
MVDGVAGTDVFAHNLFWRKYSARQVLLQAWVTSVEPYWVIFGEQRRQTNAGCGAVAAPRFPAATDNTRRSHPVPPPG